MNFATAPRYSESAAQSVGVQPMVPVQPSGSQWIHVFASSSATDWRIESLREVRAIADLPDDWDSYGSRRPSPGTIDSVIALLMALSPDLVGPPSITPLSGGGVSLSWERRRILDIDFWDHRGAEVCLNDPETGEFEGAAPTNTESLALLVYWAHDL